MSLRVLLPLSVFIASLCPLAAQNDTETADIEMEVLQPSFVAPRQIEPVDAIIPAQLIYRQFQFTQVKARVQLDREGKVMDYIILQAPHKDLLDAAGKAIGKLRMTPALENGTPIPVIIDLDFNFRYPDIEARSVMDDIMRVTERPISTPQFVLSKPNELDTPLAVATQGPVYKPGDGTVPGNAVVEFYIDQDGKVRLPRVISSSDRDSAEAAILTFYGFTFTPPKRDKDPTVVKVRMPYTWEVAAADAE